MTLRRVHPHSRGDSPGDTLVQPVIVGSPPLAWGQHLAHRIKRTKEGFTPTRVGTARGRRSESGRAWVHPHSRGDSNSSPDCSPFSGGSPPLAWGQQLPDDERPGVRGFTPTRVGTATPCRCGFPVPAVHPHSRGDSAAHNSLILAWLGSPPLAWGQHVGPAGVVAVDRFTPTRVGTAYMPLTAGCSITVHPHSRGDSPTPPMPAPGATGSPPLAWGQPSIPRMIRPPARFTPTRVGTAGRRACIPNQIPVHPHSRGDSPHSTTAYKVGWGSPPLAWGQRGWGVLAIPGLAVHPHSRGDSGGDTAVGTIP